MGNNYFKRKKVNDVIVIGSGIIGLSVAFHLAKKGIKTIILEKDTSESGASVSCPGEINLQSKVPNFYLALSIASVNYYPEFISQLDVDPEFRQPGGITVLETEKEYNNKLSLIKEQEGVNGYKIEVLNTKDALNLEPSFSPHIKGLAFCPLEGSINPFLLILGIKEALKKMGAKTKNNNIVLNIKKLNDSFIVSTSQGVYLSKYIVNCAGLGANQIGNMLNIDIPIYSSRGQLMVTERWPKIFNHYVCTLNQTKTGNIVIGMTDEINVNSKKVTCSGLEEMAKRAVRIVPILRNVHIIRTWAGIRVKPLDQSPIFGSCEKVQNFFVIVSHSGFVLGPILGKLMAELITTGSTSISMEKYNLERKSLVYSLNVD
jgi:sarcosine oxidase subunit beta